MCASLGGIVKGLEGYSRDQVMPYLAERGVGSDLYYQPVLELIQGHNTLHRTPF